ncbi:hypothetical protein [Actinomadura welshii]|uniref:hypothetical protein n=1 Tax=Actinomadura welshii TaxID=3103817 RepID=UPI000526F48E|nr:hypothetical protein [Actinomadura madurae]
MRRMLSVGFAPHAVFVTCVWTLIRAGSFSGHSHWQDAVPHTPFEAGGIVLGIGACAAVLGLLLYPFQIRAVRVLEGYWDRWSLTARLADLLLAYQRRRVQAMRRATAPENDDERDPVPTASERKRADVARRLAGLPPRAALLPTALGNALRAGELRAGERYGLTTLQSWPRIVPQISRPLMDALNSARDMLDSSVNLCYSFLACTVALTVATFDEPSNWWLPTAALAAAALAYKGAVTAAQTYAQLMFVVYDLHRFDLVKALHYRLPDHEEEWALFQRISDALTNPLGLLPYEHAPRAPNGQDDLSG